MQSLSIFWTQHYWVCSTPHTQPTEFTAHYRIQWKYSWVHSTTCSTFWTHCSVYWGHSTPSPFTLYVWHTRYTVYYRHARLSLYRMIVCSTPTIYLEHCGLGILKDELEARSPLLAYTTGKKTMVLLLATYNPRRQREWQPALVLVMCRQGRASSGGS